MLRHRDNRIAWFRWNDPNGSYADEYAEGEGIAPLDVESAVDLVMQHVEENLETPEEMRSASARQSTPTACHTRRLRPLDLHAHELAAVLIEYYSGEKATARLFCGFRRGSSEQLVHLVAVL